jgi:hypothetical protein
MSSESLASAPAPSSHRTFWLEDIASRVEARYRWVLAGFVLLYLAICWFISATRLLWLDELFTYYPAKLPRAADVVDFFVHHDLHTPVTALLMRFSMQVLGDNYVGQHAPFVLFYLLMCLCLFRFVSRWAGPLWGLVAAALPLVASTFHYACEMRAYPIVMGAAAAAAVCWQEADGSRRRFRALLLLWAALAFTVSTHYYALLVFVPFAVAELVKWRERGSIDWPVWLVLATAPLILVIFIPAIRTARAIYANGFWAKASLGQVEETYRFLLVLAFAPMLASLIAWAMLTRRKPNVVALPALQMYQWVFVGCWALLPVYAVLLSFITGAFTTRYALSAMIGVTLCLTLLAWRRSSGDRTLALVIAAVLLGWFALKGPRIALAYMADTGGYPFRTALPFAHRSWMPAISVSRLPVVVTPAVYFAHFQHYVSPEVHSRVYYLVNREYARQIEGMDTGELNLIETRTMIPLNIAPYDAFVRDHRRFLLLAKTDVATWQLVQLRRQNAQVSFLDRDGAIVLFDVTIP